jgi:anti-sigma factor RsiW
VISIIQCYVDGECDAHTALAIADHLDRCRHCQEELANIRWLKAAVRRCHGRPESPPCR